MPVNWKKYRLGDLIEVNKTSIRKGDLNWINYIDIKSVGTGFYEEPKRMNFEDAPSRARRLLKEGDTVISSVRPNLKSYFYSQNLKENSIASTGFAVLTPKNIDKRFLYYLTTNDNYTNYLVQSCTGSAYPAFGPQVLLDSEVVIPESIQEQKSIASILSALDDKIELNLQMNKTLEEMAMALYKHWFVDFGPFQDGEFVDSELGEIPKGWEVKRLNEFALKKSESFNFKNKEDVVFVNTGDVQEGRFLHSNRVPKKGLPGQAKKAIAKGDILYSEIRPKNKRFAYVNFDSEDYVVSTKFLIINPKDNILSKLLYRILTMQSTVDNLNSIAEGRSGTFPQITFDAISDLQFILPPLNIQEQFQTIVGPMELQQDELYLENQTLTRLRDTLLPKLISGEVRVKDAEKTLSEVL
jgi:type I restriction enzyme S subunit